jgi:hypothetical protein
MFSLKTPPFNGWPLLGWITAAVLAMAAAAALSGPEPVDAARLVVRFTARTSLVLFVLAFTASGLARLAPSSATRWQLRNRRYLGLGFAVSHLIHAAALVALGTLDRGLFLELTTPVSYFTGGLAYLFIVLMTATSFNRTAAMIGPKAWAWLHTAGAWYIWMSFALNFGKRFAMNGAYWPAMVVIGAALAVRLVAVWRRPKRGPGPSGPPRLAALLAPTLSRP